MNNYLSHRWPSGSPAPVAAPTPPPQKPKKKRRGLRVVLIILLCLLIAGAIAAGSYFGILWAADHFDFSFRLSSGGAENTPPASTPAPSDSPAPSTSAEWSAQEDLIWAEPDPDTSVSLTDAPSDVLTPQEIYNNNLPSVVYIEVSQKNSERYSAGSGVVITESGYIVTNYHVIRGGKEIFIMTMPDQKGYPAKLVGYDEEYDLAVLKTDAPGLTPATLADSDRLQVGDPVYAIGNPLGFLFGSMTEGLVSSLPRQISLEGRNMNLLLVSASFNAGNSGGALFDTFGRMVGITVGKFTGLNGNTVQEGLGLVIPITDVFPLINHIIHTGTSCRPSLGILCYEAVMGDLPGILVDEVTPGTPAAKVLKPGDFIIAANGHPLQQFRDLSRILYNTGVGNPVELTVIRDGEELTVRIFLYDRLTQ